MFSGPWHLALAEGICVEPGGPPIVASLGSLVHKSLVQCLGDDAAGTRYRMLETVRLYAQQRLVDMGEANELRDRHLGWYVGRIDEEGLDVHMLSVAHIAQYVRDYSNIRAAIDWAITTGAVEEAATLVIVGSVQRLMPAAANTVELIDIAEELIELDVSAATKARLLVAEAWLYWTFKPDEASGIEIGRRAVDAARHAGDAFALAQALVFDTFYRTDFQPSYGAYWEEVEEVALASGSTLVYDVAVSMIRGSPQLKNDAQWSIENALSFDPDQEVVGIAQFQSCVGGVVSGIITNQLEISHLLADRFQAISDRLGLATSWLFPYGKSLVAAAEGKLSDARSLMEVARISEESSRVGPTRGDFLLVPAIVAAGEGRFADCACLLEISKANPIPLAWGSHLAVYLYLRDLARTALEPDQLAATREAGRQIDTHTALTNFLQSTAPPTNA